MIQAGDVVLLEGAIVGEKGDEDKLKAGLKSNIELKVVSVHGDEATCSWMLNGKEYKQEFPVSQLVKK